MLILGFSAAAAGTLSFTTVASGEASLYPAEAITLGETKPARFSHTTHVDLGIDCGECHHDKDRQPLSSEQITGQQDRQLRCAKCHNDQFPNEKLRSLRNIFHTNCRDCHKDREVKGKKGPTKCTDCHITPN